MPEFSKRSIQHLSSCKEPLVDLFTTIIKERDCTILEGYRNKHDQNLAFAQGRSKAHYPDSNHNQHPSIAVDVMPYPIKWDDKLGQLEFATYVFNTAMKMNIRVHWGGQFKNFYDAPHWELIHDK